MRGVFRIRTYSDRRPAISFSPQIPQSVSCCPLNSEHVLNYDGCMMTEARAAFKSSELSRGSADVFAAASDHPVTVTRRDAEPLVLMSESEDRARNELLGIAGQLIGIATKNDGDLTSFMSDQFPWMLALKPEDRNECAREVLEAARASFSAGQSHLAMLTLTSWKETAEAIAAGLGSEPIEWLDHDVAVERP